MSFIPLAWMAPLMFAGLVLFMVIGFPVAFSLAAVGLFFGFLAIEHGYFDFALMQALSELVKRIAFLRGIGEWDPYGSAERAAHVAQAAQAAQAEQ
jgi:hypothetical protein